MSKVSGLPKREGWMKQGDCRCLLHRLELRARRKLKRSSDCPLLC